MTTAKSNLDDRIALRVDDAVIASGLSRTTIHQEIKEGRLKSRMVAGRRLILVEDLAAFLRGAA
jgi:predicted site-specific integrase-resolvase